MALIDQAISLHQRGSLVEAEAAYKTVLDTDPNHFDALHMLGLVHAQRGSLEEAERYMRQAVSVDPNVAHCLYNLANVLCQLKRFDEAIELYQSATKLAPNQAALYLNCGKAYYSLRRYDEALAVYEKAVSLQPKNAEIWLGLGNVFHDLKRDNESLAAYGRALEIKPDLFEAWAGCGNVLYDRKQDAEALAAFDKSLSINPDLGNAWLGHGNVLHRLMRHDEALVSYDRALALAPNLAEAWFGRAHVCYDLKRHDEALEAYNKGFAIKPDATGAEGYRLHSKLLLCNWENFEADCDHLIASVQAGKLAADPFSFLQVNSSAEDQHQCARLWTAKRYPPVSPPLWKGELYKHPRIRVGYMSADFHEHPVAHLTAGIFENHDRAIFDVTAISTGPNDGSQLRVRLERSFDRFIEAESIRDDEVAARIRTNETDILVDLTGLTQGDRIGVLARRPAPIQVNYLGFPGTVGADYVDYILADPIVIPMSQQNCYSEKIVHLPNSYQPNDTTRTISDAPVSRDSYGLPADAFVFCSFNNNYKITPQVFDRWMRILQKVPGSVLWLFESNAFSSVNLKKEAQSRGIAAERLIFAKSTPLLADHLARYRLADLFLDTLPYNAHATASDALWAGLPVLTQIGSTFAGRVAASALTAIGLTELIAETGDVYEKMAVDLALHRERLTAISQRLAQNRSTRSLFDIELFTRHIEAAYIAMYERYRAGVTPDHIVVPE